MTQTAQWLGYFLTSIWPNYLPLVFLSYDLLKPIFHLGCPRPRCATLWAAFPQLLHDSNALMSFEPLRNSVVSLLLPWLMALPFSFLHSFAK